VPNQPVFQAKAMQSLTRARLLKVIAFVGAALVATLIAWGAAALVERISARVVTSRLLSDGITYAQVEADGLQIVVSGTAPSEAARYRMINLVGTVVEASRIRDEMEVIPVKAVEAPRFSVEMLRNDDGIQLIGLLPEASEVEAIMTSAQELTPTIPLSDMIETAAYPAPEGWEAALAYGMDALKLLPRSKISVAADGVAITAIAASDAEKRRFEAQLNSAKPAGLAVKIEVSAPRPVLTPFTLRFVKDAEGSRFDACSADTEAARDKIVKAAAAVGVDGVVDCTIGLGVPTPRWADAAVLGIKAVASLANATLTFSDADVTLLAGAEVPQDEFDRVVGDLENGLPDVFSLKSTLEKKVSGAAQGPAEFTATLAPETHRIELRGRLTDVMLRDAVENFSKAEFGSDKVYVGTRLDADLPDGWPLRVLAGLQALAELDNGKLTVRADTVEIRGVTGSTSGKVRISQILSEKLGQGKPFKVDVRYDKELDPLAGLPTPVECAKAADAVLAKGQITFKPGSAEIDAAAEPVMKALAEALKRCGAVKLEVGGFTDSQGSEEGNRALSQARAEAVVLGLQGRQIDIGGMVAKGYGEANPIADNGTEAGREANRRIEFNLIGPVVAAGAVAPAATAEAAAGAAEASDAAGSQAAPLDAISAEDVAGDSIPEVSPEASDSDAAAAPDFSGDTSPSVAPTEMTKRPKARPATNG
jgi:OmpA-OmpF porin, OOP family